MIKTLLSRKFIGTLACALVALTASADITLPLKSMTPNLGHEKVTEVSKVILEFGSEGVELKDGALSMSKGVSLYKNEGTPSNPKFMQYVINLEPIVLDDQRLEIDIDPKLTGEMEYYLIIPSGLVMYNTAEGTAVNDAVYCIFTVSSAGINVGPLPAGLESVTPPRGQMPLSTYSNGLNSIVLDFAENVTINPEAKSGIEMYYNSRPYAVETIKGGSDKIKVDGKRATLTFTKGLNLGYYDIKIPENLFMLGSKTFEGCHLEYTVVMGEAITITPEEGPVDELEQFLISFDNTKWVSVRDYTFKEPTFTYADGTEIKGVTAELKNDNDSHAVIVMLSAPVTKIGSYKLTLPAGCLNLVYDGGTGNEEDDIEALNEERTFLFDIVAVPKPVILPRESRYNYNDVDNFKNFRLSFKEGLKLASYAEGTVATFTLLDEVTGEETSTAIPFKVAADRTSIGNNIVYTIPDGNEATEAVTAAKLKGGKYNFIVAPDKLTFSKEGEEGTFNNPLYVYAYTYDSKEGGVATLVAEYDKVTVVTTDGIVLFRDADTSVLGTLADGLYIVNGHKFIVRR